MNTVKLYLSIVALGVANVLSAQTQFPQYEPAEKLSDAVNSGASEESMPLISKDGNTMYFVRSFHPDNTGGTQGGHDIWYSTKNDDGTWSAASNDLSTLNSKTNNAVAGVSEDGSTIYLVNTYEGKNQSGIGVSKSTRSETGWSKPESLKVPGINPVNEFYSFYITPEEDVLLISMQDNFSKGQNDIYLAVKDAQGSWNVPMNLGDRINTAGNEISPYLSPDRKKLYFSTDGRGGMGGQDIFVSERQGEGWTSWGMPVNLPNGINSGDFDAYFSIYEGGEVYFCSSRNDTIANIYTTVESEPKEMELEPEEEDEIAEEIDVEDSMVDDTIEVVGADGDVDPRTQIANGDALDNIYFDYDKHFLRSKSKEVLDVVVRELKNDASLQVRLVGHCDNRGSQEYNLPLSQNRANSAREYLEANGIASNRIDTEGKGKRQPAATNETEEGRQLNRRVEIYFK